MRAVWSVAFLVGVTGWCAMVAVGVLHGAGAVSWTLSYDEAVAVSALVLCPVLLLLGAFVAAVGKTGDRG